MKLFALVALVIVVGSCAPAKPPAPIACCDGTAWQSWTPAERHAFIQAYVDGLAYGHNLGCEAALRSMQERTLMQSEVDSACLAKNPTRGRDFTDYEEKIADFYRRRPENRTMQIATVIDVLMDLRRIKGFEPSAPSR